MERSCPLANQKEKKSESKLSNTDFLIDNHAIIKQEFINGSKTIITPQKTVKINILHFSCQ